MSTSSDPKMKTYKAEGAILPYTFVKWGTAEGGMLACGANEKPCGIYQGEDTLASGEFGDVALMGGGALLKISETITRGKYLTSTASGQGEVADAADEPVGAIAFEDGVADDIIGVEVTLFDAQASDA
jgi:hypothetical protein